MTSTEKFRFYLSEALQKVSDKQYRRVSDALIESLPAILKYLSDTIQSSFASVAERRQALEMYDRMLARVLKGERQTKKLKDASERRAAWVEVAKPAPEPMTDEEFAKRLVSLPPESYEGCSV